jgi:hypothetical protein
VRHIAVIIALLLSLPGVLVAQADTVRGVVYDSLAAAPLAGAFVTAEGGTASAVTDSLGRFVLVAPTRVAQVVVYHDALDRLGLGALVARRGETATWSPRMATPTMETVWQRLCGTRRPSNGLGGIVIGSTRFADDTTRVGGARVVIEWESLRLMAAARSDSVRYESVTARSDSTGQFVACGVQEFGQAGAMASAAEFKSGSVLLLADVRPLRRVDLVLAAASARAMVSGMVRDENGQAVASATITLDGVDDAVVTDGEVLGQAQSKTCIEDVLRVIYTNREWLRKYSIKLALVKNPKVPQGVSMRLMNTLHEHDVKSLAKDKNVPGSVQMLAKKQMEKKAAPKREGG